MATKKSSNVKTSTIFEYVVIIAVIVVVLAAIYYVYKAQNLSTIPPKQQPISDTEQTPPLSLPTPTTPPPPPTPTPKPIPHGKIDFTTSTTWPGPKFSVGSLDPYDPSLGAQQIITITAMDTQPVQKIWATMKTDKKTSAVIPFHRTSGTDLSGVWQGAWTADDTYLYIYNLILEAQSANGNTKVEITLR